MQMKQRLIQTPTTTPLTTQPQYFIDRYNQVVQVYNNSVTTFELQLELLDSNRSFAKLSGFIAKPFIKIIMVILLAFAPVINLLILGMFVFYYFFLLREGKKHKSNLRRAKNPMETFYFLPDVCYQIGKHCTTLTIKINDIQGFTFNKDLYQELKSKFQQSDNITVTIYDQYFYDSYHLFKKQQYKISAWILLSMILITADIIFYGFLAHIF